MHSELTACPQLSGKCQNRHLRLCFTAVGMQPVPLHDSVVVHQALANVAGLRMDLKVHYRSCTSSTQAGYLRVEDGFC